MKRPSLLSDFAQIASGAAAGLGGVKSEIDMIVQSQLEKLLAKRGLVSREDFDAAQLRIAALAERIEKLESQQQAPKKSATAKAKAKTSK